MKQRQALITGVGGQDGFYLACHLLSIGYTVHGLVRGHVYRLPRLVALREVYKDRFFLHSGDILDLANLIALLSNISVDEIYHLAAQSHVALSFEQPLHTYNVNALGTVRMLEAINVLNLNHHVRFYNACSSEVFGRVAETPQTETTLFQPVSPYGVSKSFAYRAVEIHREQYQMFAVSGILFNHESPLRNEAFVTRKITLGVARIARGTAEEFQLGHLDSERDWTHAKDMVRGMHLMIRQETPKDLVLASGQSRSVRQFVETAFDVIGVKIQWRGKGVEEIGYDASTGTIRVRVDPQLFRPIEVNTLQGDASLAAEALKWRPTISFEDLVREMVHEDLAASGLRSRDWKL